MSVSEDKRKKEFTKEEQEIMNRIFDVQIELLPPEAN